MGLQVRGGDGEQQMDQSSQFIIRPASAGDCDGIAATIVEAFNDEFRALNATMEELVTALSPAVDVTHFWVAVERESGQVVGTVGFADETGYPMQVQVDHLRRSFGFIRGSITAMIMRDEFYRPARFSPGQAHIDFVAVRVAARGHQLASRVLRCLMAANPRQHYTLDVTAGNEHVIPIYESVGFRVERREKENLAWFKGFKFRYLMRHQLA